MLNAAELGEFGAEYRRHCGCGMRVEGGYCKGAGDDVLWVVLG